METFFLSIDNYFTMTFYPIVAVERNKYVIGLQ